MKEKIEQHYKKLLMQTKITGKNLRIRFHEANSMLKIKIDYPNPIEDRKFRRSITLTFRYSEEFLSDHKNNIISNTPDGTIIEIVNKVDWDSNHRLEQPKPEIEFIIKTNGAISEVKNSL